MTAEVSGPLNLKAHLDDADRICDALPWKIGRTETQHKQARGRASALAHQLAALLATGLTAAEIHDALADVDASRAPDAAAQEKLWRAALKRANRARKTAGETHAQ